MTVQSPQPPVAEALIFDFDGVVADSELLANAVLASCVSRLGLPTTAEDSLVHYAGRRWADVAAVIEAQTGRPLPVDFADSVRRETIERFRADLTEVRGASAFIRRFADVPRCIASSSSPERLALCLDLLSLADDFAGRVYSADGVARGKPHPDIFLHAAQCLGVAPERCLVIEDSTSGIVAAGAAGMASIGLCAASHIRDGHAERLRAAGALHLAASWEEAEAIAQRLLATPRRGAP